MGKMDIRTQEIFNFKLTQNTFVNMEGAGEREREAERQGVGSKHNKKICGDTSAATTARTHTLVSIQQFIYGEWRCDAKRYPK